MKAGIFKSLSLLLILEILFPAHLLASSRSIVVVPVHDGVSDNISDDLADTFSRALKGHGFDVVSKEKVRAVLEYHRGDSGAGGLEEVKSAIIRAREHYYNFDYAEASAQAGRAIGLLEKSRLAEGGSLLRDAYITAGIIEKSEKSEDLNDSVIGYFKKALSIDPQYELDRKAFPPSTIELFEGVKAEVLNQPVGSIRVDTNPKVAEVYINGVLKGVTPIVISGLPAARYSVAVRTNKYRPVERMVSITAGGTVEISERLVWSAPRAGGAIQNILTSPEEATRQIEEGVRISYLLRVPNVVMIDADEVSDGSGEIAVRMIDSNVKAGHNPIIIRYMKDKATLAGNLSHTAKILMEQSKTEILTNPQKYLDPESVGDPVLLGKRRKELYTIPAFWALVGGVLAATTGGVAAAVASGGGKPDTGSVNVQFK